MVLHFDAFYFICAVLATCRVTELLTVDRISSLLRRRPGYLWTCQRCVSMWAAIACTFLYFRYPVVNMVLALSTLFIWSGPLLVKLTRLSPDAIAGRGVVVDVDANGNIRVLRSDFDIAGSIEVLMQLTELLRTQMRSQAETVSLQGDHVKRATAANMGRARAQRVP